MKKSTILLCALPILLLLASCVQEPPPEPKPQPRPTKTGLAPENSGEHFAYVSGGIEIRAH